MEIRRHVRYILPAVLLVIAGMWLYCRFGISEEERVLRALEETRRKIETRSILGFVEHISPNYRDQWGHGVDMVKAAAAHVMRRFPVIEVDVVEPEVTVSGNKASVVCYARITAGKSPENKEEIGQEFTKNRPIRIEFVKADGEWLISGVFRSEDGTQDTGFPASR